MKKITKVMITSATGIKKDNDILLPRSIVDLANRRICDIHLYPDMTLVQMMTTAYIMGIIDAADSVDCE